MASLRSGNCRLRPSALADALLQEFVVDENAIAMRSNGGEQQRPLFLNPHRMLFLLPDLKRPTGSQCGPRGAVGRPGKVSHFPLTVCNWAA